MACSASEKQTTGEAIQTLMMATADSSCNFKPMKLPRRALGDFDVHIDMKYCGVCHSDLHGAAGHMAGLTKPNYPFVPGHELAGVVAAIGAKVTKFEVGDHIGVGCMVDSCLSCSQCAAGEEQQCKKGSTGTYNAKPKHGRADSPQGYTLGGYTRDHIVHEHFGIKIPKGYPLEFAGPVMCAGITMYDPLKKAKIGQGSRVGIVGLGGLGQMGARLAKAMGAEVTVISRSLKKTALAKECGATHVVASTDEKQMQEHAGTLDLILNTVPVYHKYDVYRSLLNRKNRDSAQVILGLHAGIGGALVVNKLTFGNSSIRSSGIGGISNTQEVLDLCDKMKIYPDIEIVPCSKLNEVYELLDKANDSGKRYVLDINTLVEDAETGDAPSLAEPTGTVTAGRAVKEGLWLFFTGRWR